MVEMSSPDDSSKAKKDSSRLNGFRFDNIVPKRVKDTRENAAKVLRREFSDLVVYDKTYPEGGNINEWIKSLPSLRQLHVPPLRIPISRRLQTLAVAWHTGCFLYLLTVTMFLLANPLFWWFMAPYLVYHLLDRTASNGGVTRRYSNMFRSLKFWKHFCDYFPLKVHKVVDLQPTFTRPENGTEARDIKQYTLRLWPSTYVLRFNLKKVNDSAPVATGPRYIFGYHPHGVAALGAFGAMATEGSGWSKKFPGIPVCLCTLINQFQIPLYKDYLLALGCTSVGRNNVLKVLENNYSVCIVIGGAQESLLSKVGSTKLVINKRKGFVKLALEAGNVNLVPIYGFGETDCFRILESSKYSMLHKFQQWVKRHYGFTIPFFFARGVFNYDFGFLPFRNPIDVVVGEPIYVGPRRAKPTREEVDHYHSLYMKGLKKVFDDHKEKFGYGDKELEIAE
ncbi:HEL150Cp [Eremothecium sinecaudum]|uniref:Diacylglycerol O-acyltransferase n=1 Tax=Eremothecium sinecaudum TaxID=45286 RepID=A0A0X8HSP0_9SACH|nr:HEL150Cp [Eremothecium sinecaudum]AMD21131.1 HEL150Cp [Eremothecium sinecaudum]